MLNTIFYKIKNKNRTRSGKAVLNIALSLIAKGVSIVCSLIIVPLTIGYLNPTNYGVWLTLSSVISWISFFDLGLGNGFRNKFAEAKAQGDIELAKQYVSTTYFTISIIVLLVFIVVMIINSYINWSTVFNIDSSYSNELTLVFAILSAFFCFNMICNLFSTLLTADQNPGVAAIINGLGSVCSVVMIKIITYFTIGSLTNLALYYSGIPCLVMFLASIFAFHFTHYRTYKPSIKNIRRNLIKNILNVGVKFFVIYMCMLLIFQVINIVLSRELGSESVAQYNISHKYFNILYMVLIIIISPFWTAFTDAYHKSDYEWMKKTLRKLEQCWCAALLGGVLMLSLSAPFFNVWLQDKVEIPFILNLGMLIFVLSQTLGAVYMHLINGIGFVRLQFIVYVCFALVSLPLLTYSCRLWGVQGIILVPSLVYFTQAMIGKVQLSKILNKSASGIWKK